MRQVYKQHMDPCCLNRRMLKALLRVHGETGYALQEGSHTVESGPRMAYSYPGLPTECTRHFVTVVLDERSGLETLGIAGQDRFNTLEYAAAPSTHA